MMTPFNFDFKLIGILIAGLLILVLIGGIGYKIVAPTSRTVVGQGGRVITVNTDTPKIPIGGCALWRVNTKVYWEKGFNTQEIRK